MTLYILVHQFINDYFGYMDLDIFDSKYKGLPN